MEPEKKEVWMCQIETCDPKNAWQVYYTFPAKSQPKAIKEAARLIVTDLWEDLYKGIPADDNDIIDKLAYAEQHGGKYVTEFHNEEDYIEYILVTIWETVLA